ncbi:MAG: extracellular solute-binding protein, partial [Geminicoccaceae bacterium]|nr:extracellular solute-binding protein [Geminicoccaceae bacterium]
QIAEWQKDKTFDYGGRRGDSLPKFTTGECGMWMNSSAYYGSIKEQAGFEFGITMLPYDSEVVDAPQNSIIGGATLWVLQGGEPEAYKGVAKFFTYLSSPEVQAWWHQETGYVPITTAAAELSREQGFYEKNPGTDIAIKQLSLNEPTDNSKGVRFGNFVQIRDVINEELEAVWAGSKAPQAALDEAAERGDDLLRKFER